MVTKEMINQEISNGNLNPKILSSFFRDMRIKSFQYDYEIQKNLIAYHEMHFSVSDGRSFVEKGVFGSGYKRVRKFNAIIGFTYPGMREMYKRSKFFLSYMDMDEITEHRKYFRYNLLVFAGDKILLNYRVRAYNEKVQIFFLEEELKGITDITVQFLPDSLLTYADTTVSDYNYRNLDATVFPACKKFTPETVFYGFWINKETKKAFMIKKMYYMTIGKIIQFMDLLPTDPSLYTLLIVGVQRLQSVNDFTPDTEWIQFSEQGMPLPKANIMVMKLEDNSYTPAGEDITLTEYYPNIYKVTNPKRLNYRLLSFYEESPQNNEIVYDNEIKYYMKKVDLLEDYKAGTVNDVLKEFKPIDWDYSIDDFIEKNPYKKVNMQDIWDGFKYKIESISTMMKRWYFLYEEYERRTYGFLSGWYHVISHYDNMDEKIRLNVSEDIDDGVHDIPFIEPQYVFIYLKDNKYGDATSYIFHVDGRYTIPTRIIQHKGYQYVYFPKRLIKNDSIIEVERFDGIEFRWYTPIPREGLEFSLSKFTTLRTIANSLFLVSPDGKFLQNGEIECTIVDKDLGEVPVDLNTSVFIIENDSVIRLKPTDAYTDENVLVCCTNKLIKYNARESGLDYKLLRENLITLNPKKTISLVRKELTHRLRIYTQDGRLIPKRGYNVLKYENFFDTPKFSVPINYNDNVQFQIAYIGYDEKLIYHRDDIPANGFISVEGRISRPLNLAIHDVYLNGFKLTKFDIEFVSPFKFIIKDLSKFDTLSHIEIYEKIHLDDMYLKFEYNEQSNYIMDRLVNNDPVFYQKILDDLESITPSGRVSDIDQVHDWFYDLFHEYVPYQYINADFRHDLEAFHHAFNKYGRCLLNADDRVRYGSLVSVMYRLSHDLTLRNYGENPDLYPKLVSLERSEASIVPDWSIEVPEEEYIKNGYFTEDYNVVYDEPYTTYYKPFIPTETHGDAELISSIQKHESGFEHQPFDGHYKFPEGIPDDEVEFKPIGPDWYKMKDVYPGYYSNMDEIVDLDEFLTLINESYDEMFDGCENLTWLPQLNYSNCRSLVAFCRNMKSLHQIPVSNTSNVQNWTSAFEGTNLTNDEIQFDFSGITNAKAMFKNAENITSVFAMPFHQITDFSEMYYGTGITEVPAIDCTSLTSVEGLDDMLRHTEVTRLDLEHVDSSIIPDIRLNRIGENLKEIYVDGVRLKLLTNDWYKMKDVYPDIYSTMTEIPDELVLDQLYTGDEMFDGCEKLETIPEIEMSRLLSKKRMFQGCTSLPEKFPYDIDLSGVEDIGLLEGMFADSSVHSISVIGVSDSIRNLLGSVLGDVSFIEFENTRRIYYYPNISYENSVYPENIRELK